MWLVSTVARQQPAAVFWDKVYWDHVTTCRSGLRAWLRIWLSLRQPFGNTSTCYVLSRGMLAAHRASQPRVSLQVTWVMASARWLFFISWSLSAVKSRWCLAHITVQTPVTEGSVFTSTPQNPIFPLRGGSHWNFAVNAKTTFNVIAFFFY